MAETQKKTNVLDDLRWCRKPNDNYILDFFCHELMLGIEIDGYSHDFLEVFKKN